MLSFVLTNSQAGDAHASDFDQTGNTIAEKGN
jgi:hypothetical protein